MGNSLVVLGIAVCALLLLGNVFGRRRLPLPPGPKGRFPGLGMTFDAPKKYPWVKYAEWASIYGPIIHFRIGLQHIIVIGSGHVAREFLDRRSQIYSSRPPSLVGQILTGGKRAVLMPYGPRWRAVRKSFANMLTAKKCDEYANMQTKEAITSCYDVTRTPERYRDHLARYSLSIARSIAFGRRVPTPDDEFSHEVRTFMEQFSKAMASGRYIIEYMPFLNRLPRFLKPWQAELEGMRQKEFEFATNNLKTALMDVEEHPDRPCIALDLKKNMEKANIDEYNDELQLAITCLEILGTGSETTATSLMTTVHALAMNPGVVAKAHEELDRVIGRKRFPTWTDEPELPYLRAIIKEQHRWASIAPLAFAHWSEEEDVVEGYRIPKNSIVRINTWAIHHDPNRYEEPERFKPERFLGYHCSASAYANKGDVDGRDHFSYGSGKRICVGLHLAERSLFSMTSALLQCFDIRPALGPDGKEVSLENVPYSSNLISFPDDFPVRFVVRNDEIKKMLDQEWNNLYGNGPVTSWTES
ncbi:hypothetical protein FPOAC2_14473 [Fusarium poae]|uniref:Cytochrome P450 n=1 Tax=Fusarium poae TaxID=36050 RepID=A0A1B8A6B4_FUSPO|nr:hypothetical protein FPOA_13270 [Fusarium poae]